MLLPSFEWRQGAYPRAVVYASCRWQGLREGMPTRPPSKRARPNSCSWGRRYCRVGRRTPRCRSVPLVVPCLVIQTAVDAGASLNEQLCEAFRHAGAKDKAVAAVRGRDGHHPTITAIVF